MTTSCHPATRHVRSSSVGFEPITLDEARAQCLIADDMTVHDWRLTGFIQDAREQVEKDAMLAIATGTYSYKITQFPASDYLELHDLSPITSITSITYVAPDGDTDTWTSSEYSLDTHSVCPIVRLGYNYSWPTIRGDINGITITVVAGYATRNVVTERIRQAVKLWVSYLWWLGPGEQFERAEDCQKAYDRKIASLRREVYA